MFDYIEDVRIESSIKGKRKAYVKIQSRLRHGFVFGIKGAVEYIYNGQRITVGEGEVIFLPSGTSYEYTAVSPEDTLYTSINFHASFDNPKVKVYSLDDFYGKSFVFESFSELWKFGTTSDKYKCLSVFYDFLAYVSRMEHTVVAEKRKNDLIEPAVVYLKEHIYDSALKIDKLHRLCGISDTYFRRIFTARFNMSPQEYVLRERISHAKSIIESGDYESIAEVAEAVGYSDPLYFGKAFKKFYGISPSRLNF
ncbi:MAG: helix-turn-helix transcriptional regulator [Clostridia bacterium]|nr:helix-turn-helix transcriptional regulator [Clostridia bacterium]